MLFISSCLLFGVVVGDRFVVVKYRYKPILWWYHLCTLNRNGHTGGVMDELLAEGVSYVAVIVVITNVSYLSVTISGMTMWFLGLS